MTHFKNKKIKFQIGSKILICCILILLINCSSKANNTNDTNEKQHITNNIKSIKESKYEAIELFGEVTKGDMLLEYKSFCEKKYNEKGYLVNKIYSIANRVFLKETFIYDRYGNVSENTYEYSEYTIPIYPPISKEIYKYNSENKLIEKREYYNTYDENVSVETYNYNSNGKLIEKFLNNELDESYQYDSKGNLILKNKYGYADFPESETFKYDSKGKLVERKVEGELTEYCKNNDKGDLEVKTIHYHNNHDHRVETYIYDSIGSLFHENRTDEIVEINEYDEKNNLIWCYYGEINVGLLYKVECRYDFDNYGNWIKKVEYVNDVPIWITEREYTYYEQKAPQKTTNLIKVKPKSLTEEIENIEPIIPSDFIRFLKKFTEGKKLKSYLIDEDFVWENYDTSRGRLGKDFFLESIENIDFGMDFFIFGKTQKEDIYYNEGYYYVGQKKHRWSMPNENTIIYCDYSKIIPDTYTFEKKDDSWMLTKRKFDQNLH